MVEEISGELKQQAKRIRKNQGNNGGSEKEYAREGDKRTREQASELMRKFEYGNKEDQ